MVSASFLRSLIPQHISIQEVRIVSDNARCSWSVRKRSLGGTTSSSDDNPEHPSLRKSQSYDCLLELPRRSTEQQETTTNTLCSIRRVASMQSLVVQHDQARQVVDTVNRLSTYAALSLTRPTGYCHCLSKEDHQWSIEPQ